jgi:hypothetical protein
LLFELSARIVAIDYHTFVAQSYRRYIASNTPAVEISLPFIHFARICANWHLLCIYDDASIVSELLVPQSGTVENINNPKLFGRGCKCGFCSISVFRRHSTFEANFASLIVSHNSKRVSERLASSIGKHSTKH